MAKRILARNKFSHIVSDTTLCWRCGDRANLVVQRIVEKPPMGNGQRHRYGEDILSLILLSIQMIFVGCQMLNNPPYRWRAATVLLTGIILLALPILALVNIKLPVVFSVIVLALIIASIIILTIGFETATLGETLPIPVCFRHKNHWQRYQRVVRLAITWSFLYPFAVLIILFQIGPKRIGLGDLEFWWFLLIGTWMLPPLILAIAFRTPIRIYPVKQQDYEIQGVTAKAFDP